MNEPRTQRVEEMVQIIDHLNALIVEKRFDDLNSQVLRMSEQFDHWTHYEVAMLVTAISAFTHKLTDWDDVRDRVVNALARRDPPETIFSVLD